MSRLARALLCLALSALALPLAAQIYTWKDESGRTVYSDKPPPTPGKGERPVRSIKPEPVKPAPVAAEGDKAKADDKTKAAKPEAKGKAGEPQTITSTVPATAAECDEMRGGLLLLESGRRVTTTDKNGETTVIDDEQRAKQIARMRERLKAGGCS